MRTSLKTINFNLISKKNRNWHEKYCLGKNMEILKNILKLIRNMKLLIL